MTEVEIKHSERLIRKGLIDFKEIAILEETENHMANVVLKNGAERPLNASYGEFKKLYESEMNKNAKRPAK